MRMSALCPECGDSVPFGQAAVVNEEGCTGNMRPSVTLVGFRNVRLKRKGDSHFCEAPSQLGQNDGHLV